MKLVNVETLSKTLRKLTIEVEASEFDKCLDQAFDKVIKDIKVDGFRPGKMPKNMFIARYGWESLYEEGINFALNETYPKALDEAKVEPIASPKLTELKYDEVKKGSSFTYAVEVEVMPEVELGEYKGLVVKKPSVKVTNKLVDERIENELKMKAENVVKEGAIASGDSAIFDFVGSIDGIEFPGGKAENYELEIGSGQFIPGFEDQMIGMIAGEEKDLKVTFPENYGKEDLAGKLANFHVTIHEVKNKVVPQLDENFIAELDLENVKTVEEYKEYIKKDIKERLTHEAEHQYENDIMKALLNVASVEVPHSVVHQEVDAAVKNLEAQAKQYGLTVDQLLMYQGIPSLDEYKKMYHEFMENDIKKQLVFNEIAKREKIEVSPEELEAEYTKLANITESDDEASQEEKLKHAKEHHNIYSVIASITNRKAFDIVKNSVVNK